MPRSPITSTLYRCSCLLLGEACGGGKRLAVNGRGKEIKKVVIIIFNLVIITLMQLALECPLLIQQQPFWLYAHYGRF